jgi:hyperosmotically inducible periplasmic protein
LSGKERKMHMEPVKRKTWSARDRFTRGGSFRGAILIAILALVILGAIFVYGWRWQITVPDSARNVIRDVSDAGVTAQVKAAFALSKRISAYEIGVKTKDGVVTLTGQSPSEIDRELAGNVARDTTGVKQVDNQIRVEPGLKPSDTSLRESARVTDLEIHAYLRERLAASEFLSGNEINVSVKDRVVTLTGRTQTPRQKAGVEQLARSIPNVADVVNQLTATNPGAAQSETSERESKDKELANQVLFALFNERDNFTNLGTIKVESRNGAVTLSGAVPSRAERALAERVARGVKGVSSVSNRLSVSLGG